MNLEELSVLYVISLRVNFSDMHLRDFLVILNHSENFKRVD